MSVKNTIESVQNGLQNHPFYYVYHINSFSLLIHHSLYDIAAGNYETIFNFYIAACIFFVTTE